MAGDSHEISLNATVERAAPAISDGGMGLQRLHVLRLGSAGRSEMTVFAPRWHAKFNNEVFQICRPSEGSIDGPDKARFFAIPHGVKVHSLDIAFLSVASPRVPCHT
jgi:hypothetical protein